jgi:hypothetical protein
MMIVVYEKRTSWARWRKQRDQALINFDTASELILWKILFGLYLYVLKKI